MRTEQSSEQQLSRQESTSGTERFDGGRGRLGGYSGINSSMKDQRIENKNDPL